MTIRHKLDGLTRTRHPDGSVNVYETRNTELAVRAIQLILNAEATRLQMTLSERRKRHGRTASLMGRLTAIRKRQLQLDNGASPWPELGRA